MSSRRTNGPFSCVYSASSRVDFFLLRIEPHRVLVLQVTMTASTASALHQPVSSRSRKQPTFPLSSHAVPEPWPPRTRSGCGLHIELLHSVIVENGFRRDGRFPSPVRPVLSAKTRINRGVPPPVVGRRTICCCEAPALLSTRKTS